MDKKRLSERDVCSKFITPALQRAGWDMMTQIHEEVSFTKGRIICAAPWSAEARPNVPTTCCPTNPTCPLP